MFQRDVRTERRRSRRIWHTLALSGALAVVSACGGTAATPTVAPTVGATVATTPTLTPTVAATTAPTAAASTSLDPLALAALFTGNYTGNWVNTTFTGSTGPAALEIGLDRTAGTMSVKLTLGGNVFGAPAPAPESLVVSLTPGAGGTTTSKSFGPVTATAVREGAGVKLTISAPNVPSARVATFTMTGTIANPASLQLAYTVTFRGSGQTAQGTVTLNRS